jgi:hypothetical protein
MPDQSIPDVAARYDTLEQMVLYAMTGDAQPIWSVEDLGRDLDDLAGAEDAIRGLHTAGLVYQTSDGYVFATRAACRMVEIVGKVA